MTNELEPGSYVTPTVRLLQPLAHGGMGTVWLAEHLVLETKVVVKLMTKAVASDAGGAARFAREAAIAAAVKSPHVVQVFDSGVTEDGVAFIVMELLEGHDLGAQLTARGRMAPLEVAAIVAQLAKALAKAHRVGVVHRDIKPENVFLCEGEGAEPFVKLLDFGTAKDELRAPFATTTGQVIGTPYYMSPEQILGEEVDARTDVWSLGVLAFEALTGARPFEGATLGAITLAIHSTSPRLTDVVPELSVALDAWFDRACARAPEDRFQTVTAAADAFVRAVTGEGAVESARDPVIVLPIAARRSGPHAPTVAGRASRTAAPSDRIATSLSSTLSEPRHERRTLTWIAAGVVTASVLGMFAFFAHEDPTSSTSASPSSSTFVSSGSPSPPVAPSSSVAPSSQVAPPSSQVAPPSSQVAPPSTVFSPPRGTPAAELHTRATSATANVPATPAASPFPRLPSPADLGAPPATETAPATSSARGAAPTLPSAPASAPSRSPAPLPAAPTRTAEPSPPAPSSAAPEPAPSSAAPEPSPSSAAPEPSPSSAAPEPTAPGDLFPERR